MKTMLGLIEKRKLKRKKFTFPSFKGKQAAPIIGVLAGVVAVIAVLGYFLAYVPYTRIQAKSKVLIAAGQERCV